MPTELKRDACTLELNDQKRSKQETTPTPSGITWCGEDDWHQNQKRGHPERPDRVGCIIETLKECGLLQKCRHVEFTKWNDCNDISRNGFVKDTDDATTATFAGSKKLDSRLAAVHNPYYLTRFSSKRFRKLARSSNMDDSSYDGLVEEASQYDSIYLAEKSGDAARRAVAASLSLADALLDGEIANGFAIVRPPGHHAEPCAAKGFCLFNNVGVVAKHLTQVKNERVLIVDFDVHHGNGTAAMFNKVSNPCYMSLHRHDGGSFFPGASSSRDHSSDGKLHIHPASALAVGQEEGLGYNVNIAWDGKGAGDKEYIAAFQKVLIPIANEFSPTVILVSAGFDAALGDLIGGCKVTPHGYGSLTRMLCECIPSAKGRVLLFLEGGYLLSVLPECAKACLEVLVDQTTKTVEHQSSTIEIHTSISTQNEESHCVEHKQNDRENKGSTSSNEKPCSESHCEVSSNHDHQEFIIAQKNEEEDWAEGLLASAADSIRDTIEAHEPHWPNIEF